MALIKGNENSNILFGTAGGDFINSLDGNDTLFSGGGIDIMSGGNGNDTLYFGSGSSFGFGGAGDDIFHSAATGNTIDGGTGMDTLYYTGGPTAMMIDMELGTAKRIGAGGTTETFTSIERIEGTAFDDTISGSTRQDAINGGKGKDIINGLANADTLNGGDGDDRIDGGAQSDTISGGNGNDLLIGGEHADMIFGGNGNDTIFVGTLFGPGDVSGNSAWGGNGNDALIGGASSDNLYGGDGIDWFEGGNGVNHIWFGGPTVTPGSSPFPGTMDGDKDTLLHDCKGGNAIDYVHEFGQNDGDRIILDNTAFKSFGEIYAKLLQKGDDVYLKTGQGTSIVFLDVQKSWLQADDFLLS
jgi:Ca2+-binding RTX toxin-like protein